eukprot:2978133-Rhodomonas_salina.2
MELEKTCLLPVMRPVTVIKCEGLLLAILGIDKRRGLVEHPHAQLRISAQHEQTDLVEWPHAHSHPDALSFRSHPALLFAASKSASRSQKQMLWRRRRAKGCKKLLCAWEQRNNVTISRGKSGLGGEKPQTQQRDAGPQLSWGSDFATVTLCSVIAYIGTA